MKIFRVIKVTSDEITFERDMRLFSYHEQDCCESHYLDFSDLTIKDFEDLEFDLSDESFFNRIEGYGIELVPLKGYTVKVPGYGSNNGYYSSNLDLVLEDDKGFYKEFNISECQDWDG